MILLLQANAEHLTSRADTCPICNILLETGVAPNDLQRGLYDFDSS
jgi:hypothetical protein